MALNFATTYSFIAQQVRDCPTASMRLYRWFLFRVSSVGPPLLFDESLSIYSCFARAQHHAELRLQQFYLDCHEYFYYIVDNEDNVYDYTKSLVPSCEICFRTAGSAIMRDDPLPTPPRFSFARRFLCCVNK